MSDQPDTNAEGTPSFGGDLVGPGTGGTPTGDPLPIRRPDYTAQTIEWTEQAAVPAAMLSYPVRLRHD